MRQRLHALPLPVCGVMLGLAALGNLLAAALGGLPAAGVELRALCGGLSALLALAVAAKAVLFPREIAAALRDPVTAGVSGTFSMGLMLLSVYAKPFFGGGAEALWLAAIALHLLLAVWFTVRFMLRPRLEQVFASVFIVYVGIAAAAVTAPAFGREALGAAACWFGLAWLLPLLILVSVRYARVPVKEGEKPLFCICAAPASLCLAGCVQSVPSAAPGLLMGLLGLSTALFLLVLSRLPKLLVLPFYPSCASFTFPFVITATAALQTASALEKRGLPMVWLRWMALAETALATALVVYTLARYLLASAKAAEPAGER